MFGLPTFKIFGLFHKSIFTQNRSSAEHILGGFVSLKTDHISVVPQPLALFPTDQTILSQSSKDWRREETNII